MRIPLRMYPGRFVEGRWTPVEPDGSALAINELSVLTWNVWFDAFFFRQRVEAILKIVGELAADVIAFQEVTLPFLEPLLEESWVRENYFVSDITGDTFRHYGVMMLSRYEPQSFRLEPLTTMMDRKLLSLDFSMNGRKMRIATVHLESLKNMGSYRATQLAEIFPRLENADDAVLTGDFNFCAAWREENDNIDSRYIDVWPHMKGDDPGYTRDTVRNRMMAGDKNKRVRFDRVIVRSNENQWRPTEVRIIGDEPISGVRDVFPSDHFGVYTRLSANR